MRKILVTEKQFKALIGEEVFTYLPDAQVSDGCDEENNVLTGGETATKAIGDDQSAMPDTDRFAAMRGNNVPYGFGRKVHYLEERKKKALTEANDNTYNKIPRKVVGIIRNHPEIFGAERANNCENMSLNDIYVTINRLKNGEVGGNFTNPNSPQYNPQVSKIVKQVTNALERQKDIKSINKKVNSNTPTMKSLGQNDNPNVNGGGNGSSNHHKQNDGNVQYFD